MIDNIIEIALKAGKSVKTLQKEIGGIQAKTDMSPLTIADITSNRIINEGLSKIAPNIKIISEEDPLSLETQTKMKKFWLVDPLDGTKEFISQDPNYTVNIALIENGNPTLGVIYAPALDTLYWGGEDIKAQKKIDGTQTSIQVANELLDDDIYNIVASKSHLNSDTQSFIKKIKKHKLIQSGSSLKICKIAEGSADIYPRLSPTYEWDIAAGHAILKSAGGTIIDQHGISIKYGKEKFLNPSFLAASCNSYIRFW